jgi:spermidine synthase
MKPQQNGMWFVEYQTEAVRSEFAVKSLSHNFNTKFQNVQLADTFQFGKVR